MWKDHVLYNFKYITFQKRQNYGDKNNVIARSWVGGGCWVLIRQTTEDFENFSLEEKLFFDTIIVDSCHYTFFQAHRIYIIRVNPKVNCEPWVSMTYQCRLCDVGISEWPDKTCSGISSIPLRLIYCNLSRLICISTSLLSYMTFHHKSSYQMWSTDQY